ncbi:MAG: type II toxin-antitoxin system HicA family toxin [Ignavibacteriae bacterium]|nr:type II toxin-antitoxin system HicA family toxin [Ignavibacteriota bacterium]
MMPKLPVLSGSETCKILQKFGWRIIRQKGSHIILVKKGEIVTLSVPNHKEVAKGTLASLIKSANLTVSEFIGNL